MNRTIWSDSVSLAVQRLVNRTGSIAFSRALLIEEELDRIIQETASRGQTPEMTLSRVLQDLRDEGYLNFDGPGLYSVNSELVTPTSELPTKCVFQSGDHSIYGDEPERFYRLPQRWLKIAQRSVGEWIVYLRPKQAGGPDYFAVAQVEQIVRDPLDPKMYLALIRPQSYLEFGSRVPFRVDGKPIESALELPDGRTNGGLAIQSIRAISLADFHQIVEAGLVDDENLLPRNDSPRTENLVQEEQSIWEGPVTRETMLTERKVRDLQFRKRVLDAYDRRCAFTGLKFINGGGRAEVQAAHIRSVAEGGDDRVTNGIALSGTIHWMFDRGLLSLSNQGKILISQKINDLESLNKLIPEHRMAYLPQDEKAKPDPRYLSWHRAWHRFVA